ncbi:MAG: hypothetical protein AAF726_01835 [Planctomycetota bacterium]
MRSSQLFALLISSSAAFSQATIDSSPDAIDWFRAIDDSGDILVGDDVSAGGSVAVHIDTSGATPVRTELSVPGASQHYASAVSGDGRTVAGTYINNIGFRRAVRWDVATQVATTLAPSSGQSHTNGVGASGDGQFVVGRSSPLVPAGVIIGSDACRWNALGDVEVLWPTPAGTGGEAIAASRDGSVVVGVEFSTFNPVAVRWEEGVGAEQIPLIPGFQQMVPQVVSADGRVTAGWAYSQSIVRVGWRHVVGEGVTVITAPPGGAWVFEALGISADGSRIAFRVGSGTAIWTEWGGIQHLEDYVADRGLTLVPPTEAYYGLAMSGDGSSIVVADSSVAPASFKPKFRIRDGSAGSLGQIACTPATPNSTGVPASLRAAGVDFAAASDVELHAANLPTGSLVLFLTSDALGSPVVPPNSVGSLCLTGAIGRYLRPGEFGAASASGTRTLRLDLTDTPQPTGSVSIAAGETWSFQAWYRDSQGGVPTSNLTPAVELLFR